MGQRIFVVDVMTILMSFFKLALVLSSFLVVVSQNPVHSVLFLILVFLNSSALLLLIQAEFLALVLVVVYVGAIAVLFLFGLYDAQYPVRRPIHYYFFVYTCKFIYRSNVDC